MNTIQTFRKLWHFYTAAVIKPTCVGHDLFLLCLVSMHARNNTFIEYGSFTGQTSAFLTSISTSMGGETLLVDNYRQFKYPIETDLSLDNNNFSKITSTFAGILPQNKFKIIDQDVLINPHVIDNPGFIYYDICVSSKTADSAWEIISKNDIDKNPIIIVVDDVINVHATNSDFKKQFVSNWQSTPLRFLKPFFATNNKIFLSNFDMPESWHKTLSLLKNLNYIQETQHKTFCNIPIWWKVPANSDIFNSYEFLYNDAMWNSLYEIYQ